MNFQTNMLIIYCSDIIRVSMIATPKLSMSFKGLVEVAENEFEVLFFGVWTVKEPYYNRSTMHVT